ncbi:MAG: hypothetical protein ACRDPM_17700, partial [Solirubrobacteraceae bacterium]
TGTTENNGDAWYCGATEEVTACVWVGYADTTTPMTTLSNGGPVMGGTFPALIWASVISAWEGIKAEEAAERASERASKGSHRSEGPGESSPGVERTYVPSESTSEPEAEPETSEPAPAPKAAPEPESAAPETPAAPTPESSGGGGGITAG